MGVEVLARRASVPGLELRGILVARDGIRGQLQKHRRSNVGMCPSSYGLYQADECMQSPQSDNSILSIPNNHYFCWVSSRKKLNTPDCPCSCAPAPVLKTQTNAPVDRPYLYSHTDPTQHPFPPSKPPFQHPSPFPSALRTRTHLTSKARDPGQSTGIPEPPSPEGNGSQGTPASTIPGRVIEDDALLRYFGGGTTSEAGSGRRTAVDADAEPLRCCPLPFSREGAVCLARQLV